VSGCILLLFLSAPITAPQASIGPRPVPYVELLNTAR
jgi:hypothetical protein